MELSCQDAFGMPLGKRRHLSTKKPGPLRGAGLFENIDRKQLAHDGLHGAHGFTKVDSDLFDRMLAEFGVHLNESLVVNAVVG